MLSRALFCCNLVTHSGNGLRRPIFSMGTKNDDEKFSLTDDDLDKMKAANLNDSLTSFSSSTYSSSTTSSPSLLWQVDLLRKLSSYEKSVPKEKQDTVKAALIKYYLGRSFSFYPKWNVLANEKGVPKVVKTLPYQTDLLSLSFSPSSSYQPLNMRLGEFLIGLKEKNPEKKFAFTFDNGLGGEEEAVFEVPIEALESFSSHALVAYVMNKIGENTALERPIVERFLNQPERIYMVLSDGSEDVVEEGEEGEEEEDGGGEGSGGLVVCSGHETVDLLKPVHQEMHDLKPEKVRPYALSIEQAISLADSIGSGDLLFAMGTVSEGLPEIKAIKAVDLRIACDKALGEE